MTILDLNQGALAPVLDEVDLPEPTVVGSIPLELNGMLLRNGPNPLNGRFEGNDVLSWWPEAAMLHGISFKDERVTNYGNRGLRTVAGYAAARLLPPYIESLGMTVSMAHFTTRRTGIAKRIAPYAEYIARTQVKSDARPRRDSASATCQQSLFRLRPAPASILRQPSAKC